MPTFIKRIKVEQAYLNFYFNPLVTPECLRYFVSVVSRDRKTYMFQMQEENGKWVIVQQQGCPYWITALEKEYSKAIWEQLHLEYVSATNSPFWLNAIYNNPFSRAAVPRTSNSRSKG